MSSSSSIHGETKEMTPDERMKMLERRAKVVRSRLVRAIDSLDTRRHQIETIGATAKRLAIPMALSAAGIVVLFGASAAAFGMAIKRRRERSLTYRLAQSIRGLNLVPQRSLTSRVAEKALATAVTLALTELVKRASTNLLDGRLPDGRIATHQALEVHHRELSTPPSPKLPALLPKEAKSS